MIRAFLHLHHGLATATALLSFRAGALEKACGIVVLRAVVILVPLATAGWADLGPAVGASAVPAAVFGAQILGSEQLSAAPRWAIYAVLGYVVEVLLVPLPLEAGIEQVLNVLERDSVIGATPGGHVQRIGQGQSEDPANARVAHAMAALELDRRADRRTVVPANHTDRKARNIKHVSESYSGVRSPGRQRWSTDRSAG